MKLTLAAILFNEEKVIERFIRSFAPAVDQFVFVMATGTIERDGTKEIAKDVCEKLAKKAYFSEYENGTEMPHADRFGAARQKAWTIAGDLSDSEDCLMWADADDTLADGAVEEIRNAIQDTAIDAFLMPYWIDGTGKKQTVWRGRIFRKRTNSFWRYSLHEQLVSPQECKYRMLLNAPVAHQPSHGKSSRERNLRILNNELSETGRNLFYLAQEMFAEGNNREFVRCAETALRWGDIDDIERHELMLQLAQTPGQDSRRLAAEAFVLMPDRREALALLVNYALLDRSHETALRLCAVMMGIQWPRKTYWTLNREWYGWKGDELWRQCLRLNGKDKEAEEHFRARVDSGKPVFSIVHATLDRTRQAMAVREMWLSRARYPQNVEYVFGLHAWDQKSIRHLSGFKHTVTAEKGCNWNWDVAAGAATGDILIAAQDDVYPPEDWDVMLTEAVGDWTKPKFIDTHDGNRNDKLQVSQIVTRAYMRIRAEREGNGENGFWPRCYPGVFSDNDVSYRSIADAEKGICERVNARHIVFFHDHPAFNPAVPWDSTYESENSPENYRIGAQLFKQRNPEATPDCLS